MNLEIFLVFCIFKITPVKLEKYDLIIIPVPKGSIHRSDVHYRARKPRYLDHSKESRLDIEHYEEPAEHPDIDDLDYNIERSLRIDNKYDRDAEGESREEEIKRNTEEVSIDRGEGYGEDKIVGGSEVDINLYPYHAAYGTNCGGAIIDKKWVITAGHCGKKPYVRVGSKYLNQGQKIRVKRSIIHPMWTKSGKDHPFDFDYQLLELEKPLQFTNNIQPIKIAHIEDMTIGKIISVSGWGNTMENGPYSQVLRAVRVPIISKEICNQVPFPYFRGALTPRMFCAGFSEGKKDACQGDSGGPAVSNDRLMGMVSFGYGCATPGSYGVYSKVAKVRDWITQVTGLSLS